MIKTTSQNLDSDDSNMSAFIKNELKDDFERVLIIGAIATIYFPELYDRFLIKNKVLDKPFTEFGGLKTSETNYFLPTLRTFAFILYGASIEYKVKLK